MDEYSTCEFRLRPLDKWLFMNSEPKAFVFLAGCGHSGRDFACEPADAFEPGRHRGWNTGRHMLRSATVSGLITVYGWDGCSCWG